MTVRSFFKLMPLRGAAPKRTGRGPLRNLHDQGGSPLDSPVFGGLGLRASDIQRFSCGRPFGKDKVWVQICPKRLFTTNTRSEYRHPFARG